MDTVGEFPLGAVRPEFGRVGADWEAESAVPDVSDEFANSISNGTENWNKGSLSAFLIDSRLA
jgi:hypothetical protein